LLRSSGFALRCPLTAPEAPFARAEASPTPRAGRPFHSHPLRLVKQLNRVGMKGATGSLNPGDVSTAANAVSEERSEPREANQSGLSRCLQ